MPTFNEFWFAQRTGGPPPVGTGTYSDPYDGSNSTNFDANMRAIMNLGGALAGKNLTIHFFPGTYQTLGWSNSDTSASVGWRPLQGWRLVGAGIDNTIIQLVEAASPNSSRWDNAIIGSKDEH